MTANMVQGFGQVSAGVPKVSNAAKSQEDGGFMDVLKESTAKSDTNFGSDNSDKLKTAAAETDAKTDKSVGGTEKTADTKEASTESAKEVDAGNDTKATEETKVTDTEVA